jgi:hypothetical protein
LRIETFSDLIMTPTTKMEHTPPSPSPTDPAHSDPRLWKAKLQASMGTVEWPFANKLLGELLNAVCHDSATQLVADDVNAALAAMHGMAPKDEAEAMLSAQMVATHSAAM